MTNTLVSFLGRPQRSKDTGEYRTARYQFVETVGMQGSVLSGASEISRSPKQSDADSSGFDDR